MQTQPAGPRVLGYSGLLIAAILLIAAALVFVGIYLVYPSQGHAPALLWIGSLGLAFAIIAYLMESASRRPTVQQATAWGFYAFGFAVLFLTLGLNPGSYLNTGDQITGVVVVLILLALSIALIAWRSRSVAAEAPQQAARARWSASQPRSALDYPSAHAPSSPTSAPPPSSPAPPATQNPPGGH